MVLESTDNADYTDDDPRFRTTLYLIRNPTFTILNSETKSFPVEMRSAAGRQRASALRHRSARSHRAASVRRSPGGMRRRAFGPLQARPPEPQYRIRPDGLSVSRLAPRRQTVRLARRRSPCHSWRFRCYSRSLRRCRTEPPRRPESASRDSRRAARQRAPVAASSHLPASAPFRSYGLRLRRRQVQGALDGAAADHHMSCLVAISAIENGGLSRRHGSLRGLEASDHRVRIVAGGDQGRSSLPIIAYLGPYGKGTLQRGQIGDGAPVAIACDEARLVQILVASHDHGVGGGIEGHYEERSRVAGGQALALPDGVAGDTEMVPQHFAGGVHDLAGPQHGGRFRAEKAGITLPRYEADLLRIGLVGQRQTKFGGYPAGLLLAGEMPQRHQGLTQGLL